MSEQNEKNGKLADRDDFWAAIGTRYVTTEELPKFGKVRLKSISELQRRRIQAGSYVDGQFSEEEHGKVFARMCCAMVVNNDGDEIFGEMDMDRLSSIDYAYSKPLLDAMNAHAEGHITAEELKKTSSDTRG